MTAQLLPIGHGDTEIKMRKRSGAHNGPMSADVSGQVAVPCPPTTCCRELEEPPP